MHRRILTVSASGALALAAALALTSVAVASADHRRRPKARASWYLALGDSLAAGAQPNAAGRTLPTRRGYANDLYAIERRHIRGLRFKDLGCLGETTQTMISGGPYCHYKGAQLSDAVRFIRIHRVRLITVDIGANDVDDCAPGGVINLACLEKGVAAIKQDVPRIAQTLRRAAGRRVMVIGMTYYDPFLAYYFDAAASSDAQLSVALAREVNGSLQAAFARADERVADVATAFGTYIPFTQTTPLTVPVAVAKLCELTWMCAPRPQGPNIHANTAGYRLMAQTFAREL
jgi:lysophospholipase L1-like esterase